MEKRDIKNEVHDCCVCGCAAFYDDESKKHIHPQCKPKQESNLHPIFERMFGSFMPAQEVNDG